MQINPINEELLCQQDGTRINEVEYMYSNVNIICKYMCSCYWDWTKQKLNQVVMMGMIAGSYAWNYFGWGHANKVQLSTLCRIISVFHGQSLWSDTQMQSPELMLALSFLQNHWYIETYIQYMSFLLQLTFVKIDFSILTCDMWHMLWLHLVTQSMGLGKDQVLA